MTSLKVEFVRISYDSIREFEELSLPINDGINVWQIRNGYGKTTTLELLRCMFQGTYPEPENFPIYKRSLSTANYSNNKTSSICLELKIENENQQMIDWKLTLEFDHADKSCRYITDSPGIGGYEEGWKMPSNFKAKFYKKPDFTQLFLFDGETAVDLAKKQDYGQIVNSIRELTGLRSIYQHISEGGYLDEDQKKAFAEHNVNNLDKSYSNWISWLDDYEIHYSKKEKRSKELTKLIDKKKKQIAKKESKKNQVGAQADVSTELKKVEKRKRDKNTELKNKTRDLLIALGNPASAGNFWTKVKSYNKGLQERKLPEGVGRQFFNEIKEADECICGRPMKGDKQAIANIEERSVKYLDDDVLGVVKTMQKEVEENTTDGDIFTLRDEILAINMEIMTIDGEIGALTTNFDPAVQKEIKGLTDEITKLGNEITKHEAEYEEIMENDPAIISLKGWDSEIMKQNGEILIQPHRFTKCINLFSLRKVKKQLESKLSATGPLMHIATGTSIIKQIYSSALDTVMEKLHKKLQEETQSLFDEIPGTGGGLIIKLDDTGFRFFDENGAEQTKANQGAVLAAAYSFVSAMSDLGSVQIPLLADSPITGMDNFTTEGWVEVVWPRFNQCIFLTTPGELKALEGGPEGKGLQGVYSDETTRFTICRENETYSGQPQTGKMVAKQSTSWFKQYAAPPMTKSERGDE